MKNINEYFEDYNKEENWTNTDFDMIDQRTLVKSILKAFSITVCLLIMLSGIGYVAIQYIK